MATPEALIIDEKQTCKTIHITIQNTIHKTLKLPTPSTPLLF